jgi:hypothetical protein
MTNMRFNHMELTFEPGTLDGACRHDIAEFYGDLFDWEGRDLELLGQKCFFISVDSGQFILCAESPKYMQSTGYDHLGLLFDSRADVDERLRKAKAWQARDERVQIKEYDDLDTETAVVHAFYVKYLLPIWFDVQVIEHKAGAVPPQRWTFVGS